MGQKINPIGFRLGINRTWDSRWFADNAEYGKLLHEDLAIRKYLMDELKAAGISKVVIERPAKLCRVSIYAARPGVIIGKKGADIEKLRGELSKMTGSEVSLNIIEIRKPEIDAKLIAALDGTGGYVNEFRVCWPDGSVHWLASRGMTVAEVRAVVERHTMQAGIFGAPGVNVLTLNLALDKIRPVSK